ncbi:hypothetical protein KO495_06775 [Colwellia sp. D2M02]|uniref:hypothetical protein n=1 Tax=Colwellia sp. D2M02 TaxID=2841562 RepID=UPI001C09B310|nr:hypothetical protein [Colwellia sp. D2M02]MBU2893028.1 hypothetical protein [Colwellia sp. D2M02]
MTIQTLASVNTQHYPVGQNQISTNTMVSAQPSMQDLLSPEQQNTLQSYTETKREEHVEQIKSNYKTAKDIDLTRAYYAQQQKLFDIYIETATDGEVDTDNHDKNNVSAISTLTSAYTELYDLHKQVKGVIEQVPTINDNVKSLKHNVSNAAVGLNGVTSETMNHQGQSLSQQQTNIYNSIMMPSSNSYLHLSA